MKKIIVVLLISVLQACSQFKTVETLTSPDGKTHVNIRVSDQGSLEYSIDRGDHQLVLPSSLGLQFTEADFTQGVKIVERSAVEQVQDRYQMYQGKRRYIRYEANEQRITIANAKQQQLTLVFRVSDDGVAFRYALQDPALANKKFVRESTSFHVAPSTKAWLQPMAVAQSGWSNTNPSYEEHYQIDVPVTAEATLGRGWVFPALFKTQDQWIVISEVGMDGSWHASHLQKGEAPGQYTIAPPQNGEVFISADGEKGGLLANASNGSISPWRIIALGSLAQVMESTLGTDLAAPAIALDTNAIKPGHSSWSWAILKDDFTTFEVQKKFIDYAADMHWDYTLIDADWDKKIGYSKLKQLVDYAAQKNIGILVWYNSSGAWNQTPYGPKSQLLTHEQRIAEFSRLREMGVKGVKIDFFGGDGQSFMAYYVDILKDAAAHNLLVNFHGATLPRGWQRTYPNLMTMESIKGFEFTTFSQADQDPVATHVATALFTRNIFDPMDYTPMVFGDIPNIKRVTENSFELAQSVLMLSGIQHFAEIPEGMATAPGYVKDFLRTLPRQWDDVKFIDGYPGKFAVITRKAGEAWYIAGINAEPGVKNLVLDLDFAKGKTGYLIASGETQRSFTRREITNNVPQAISLRPSAGFVMVLNEAVKQ